MGKESCQQQLQAIKILIIKFDYLISDIELLSEIKHILLESQNAVNSIKLEIEAYQGEDLCAHLQESSAVLYLDEIVDMEPINALEQQLLALAGDTEEGALADFLVQILDKIEQAYAVLVTEIQEFNALLEEG